LSQNIHLFAGFVANRCVDRRVPVAIMQIAGAHGRLCPASIRRQCQSSGLGVMGIRPERRTIKSFIWGILR